MSNLYTNDVIKDWNPLPTPNFKPLGMPVYIHKQHLADEMENLAIFIRRFSNDPKGLRIFMQLDLENFESKFRQFLCDVTGATSIETLDWGG